MNKGYTDVVQVFETERESECNKYLNLGWVLIRTYTTCYDDSGPLLNYQYIHYVLGWIADKGNIKYPPKELLKHGTII